MTRTAFLLLLFLIPALLPARGLDAVDTPALVQLETDPPSWLFGTIHMPDPRVTTLHPDVETAFRDADAVFTEIPMDPASAIAAASSTLRSDNRTLLDVLPQETWERLDTRLGKINPMLSAKLFLPMKTWAVYASLMVFESQLRYPQAEALDMQLYRRAESAGKEVGGLETIEEQLGAFEQFTESDHLQLLDNLLDQMDSFEERGLSISEFMIQWYLAGDADTLDKLLDSLPMAREADLRAAIETALLYDRNKRLAQRIARKIHENPGKSLFFAIGMAHLGGDRSIQAHLNGKGIDSQSAW